MTDDKKMEILTEIVNGNLGKAREMASVELRNEIKNAIAREFQFFKQNAINHWTKEEIFDKAFEIHGKTEIAGIFESCELNDEDYETLAKVSLEIKEGTLLYELYEYYLNHEYTSVENYDEIEQWIKLFCKREREMN